VALAWKERCRLHLEEKGGWERLVRMAKSSTSASALPALKLMAEYAYGKPTQPVEQSGTVTIEHTDGDTIDRALDYAAARRRLRAVS
jgi:hypothetical protein